MGNGRLIGNKEEVESGRVSVVGGGGKCNGWAEERLEKIERGD